MTGPAPSDCALEAGGPPEAATTLLAVAARSKAYAAALSPETWRMARTHAIYFVALVALVAVGPGYQPIPALLLPTLALLLHVARHSRTAWHAVAVIWPATTGGAFLAFAGTLSDDERPVADDFDFMVVLGNWVVVLVVASVLYGLHTAVLLLDREIVRLAAPRRVGLLSFPMLWAGFCTALYHVSPFGDFGSWGTVLALVGYDSLTVGATWLGGAVAGGAFTSALVAAALAQLAELLLAPPAPAAAAAAASPPRSPWAAWRPQLLGAAAALLAICSVGSCVTSFGLYPRALYQTPIQRYAPPFLDVACLTESDFDASNAFLAGPGQGTQLLLWSETALGDDDDGGGGADEALVLARAKDLSARHDVIVGVTYLAAASNATRGAEVAKRNMFALVLPPPPGDPAAGAAVGFLYQKAHPVPIVEDDVEPGPPRVPYVDTRFGRIGGAICFDFDFPFLAQAYAAGVDIMLQPSWTWGPIGVLHESVNRLRAVEGGFTHVRCASLGVSGVYDAAFGVVARKITLGRGDGFSAHVPLIRRRWTFVGATRGAAGFVAVAYFVVAAAALLAHAALGSRRVRALLAEAEGGGGGWVGGALARLLGRAGVEPPPGGSAYAAVEP